MRIFGEFAVNFDADDRAEAAGHAGGGGQRYAWELGLGVGQLKAKGDWEIRAWWQHSDQFSLDTNLVDGDVFDARVNIQGIAVKAGYMMADSISLNLTYSYGWVPMVITAPVALAISPLIRSTNINSFKLI